MDRLKQYIFIGYFIAAEVSTLILARVYCISCPDLFAELCIINEAIDLQNVSRIDFQFYDVL